MTSDASVVEFEAFVRVIRRWLRREAYDICGDWHEADDLVQVALWNVYQRWDRLERRAELGAYARRAMVRSFLTERRRSRWQREVPLSVAADAVQAMDSHTSVDDRSILLPALRRLGSRQRTVVTLRFFRDLSVEQTARALGCAPGTVTSQTVRALETLRHHLQNRPPPHAACTACGHVYSATPSRHYRGGTCR
ncbi:SigE family RNA polymerase sigma factor [Solwaraspora sp. WMMD937]|uniref:SigE family RNA polymerase sigma factor n=1 Tax=Solwaraspora sp. WMMD937 TaxID=3016090 RepID=UPI00249A0E36|nr:SigE family RNA polymerase sigma factor [Solwaraspora sp. WMMD937]WFE22480.1 SigE family RNA polymerase sigma factor [Solwaraspora sp. WMMD937]